MRFKILFATAILAAVLAYWSPVSLAARLYLYPDCAGEERAFVESLLAREHAAGGIEVEIGDFFIGRFDLDGDGQYELFVLFGHSVHCGTAGCSMKVYRRGVDGDWYKLTGFTVSGFSDRMNAHYVDIDDAPGARFRTIRSWSEGQRWSAGGYEFFVIDNDPFEPVPGDPDADDPYAIKPDVIEGVP